MKSNESSSLALDRRTLDQHTLDQHTLDQHTLDQHTIDRDASDRRTLDRHTLDRHTLNRDTLDRRTLDRRPCSSMWLGLGVWSCGALAWLGCSAPPDVVAFANGDFDPKRPPAVLPLDGALETHNPTLFRADGKYFVYSMGDGISVKSSADMRSFEDEPRLFTDNPAWMAETFPGVTALWSPTVAEFGGQFHLYYAVSSAFGSDRSCIGHATATSPSAGFEDRGMVVCSNLTGANDDWNAIDPGVLVDAENIWLVFGSYLSGIKLIALDETGARRGSELVSLAARPESNPAIQASSIMKRGSFYYLFASFDACCMGDKSTYYIVFGRSESVTGPYRDREGVDMRRGGGSVLLQGDTRWRGPGSNEIYAEGKKRYNVYHAYDAEANGRATLRISELYFDNDAWPVTAGP